MAHGGKKALSKVSEITYLKNIKLYDSIGELEKEISQKIKHTWDPSSTKMEWGNVDDQYVALLQEEKIELFQGANDDYNDILLKALADRFAEAFAEWAHKKVRCELWGYAAGEGLDNEGLINEKYQGIRPAPGYPSCPDHRGKLDIWELLNVEEAINLSLTESLAMWPTASVSGFYFSHPQSHYFQLGRIDKDQVEAYSKAREESIDENETWLAPVLGY